MDHIFKSDFPSLVNVARKKTSEVDQKYNCIAWVFHDNTRHWWPNSRFAFWPVKTPGLSELQAFEKLFAVGGWEECKSENPEIGYEKLALYGINGKPTHAARSLPNGFWTSKLGQSIDISHELSDLRGPTYGAVMRVYRKKLGSSS